MQNTTRYLFCSLLLLLACSTEKYQAGQLPEEQLHFGKGGGFAGAHEKYILLENGQLFHRSGTEGTLQSAGKVSERQARRLFEQARSINKQGQAAFKHPGNLYYFIEWVDTEGSLRWTWGDPNHPVSPEVANLYESLRELP